MVKQIPAAGARRGAAPDRLETALRAGLFCAVGLLLLTPFVYAPGALEPLSVGKALWSRGLIEIVFALWALLALARPDYRPPRSWLLWLMAAGLGVGLLAALTGESIQRSLWSDYRRMQGLVDQAHWFALALALASVLRRPGEWRAVLGANLVAGAVMACVVIARAGGIDVPVVGTLPEQHLPRLSGPFGNPAYLSVYMLLNLVLAAGFALRAWMPGLPLHDACRGRHTARAQAGVPDRACRWTAVLWTALAGLHLVGLVLADSMGAYIGLYAAICFAALAMAVLARGRRRHAAASLLVVLMLAGAGAGLRVFDGPGAAGGGPAWSIRASLQWPSVRSRLASWETGLRGVAERPVLGWGPENFLVVFGRYARGLATTSESHDRAHNKLIEVAATTGLAGLALWLALWGLAVVVFLRAARDSWRRRNPADDCLTADPGLASVYVCAAAALVGYLVQLQSLFDTVAGALVTALLLALAARLETAVLPGTWHLRLPARLASALARRGTHLALGAAAVTLALAGLAVNGRILAAADARYLSDWSILDKTTTARIDRFPPLANTWRYRYFQELERNWERIRRADPADAAALRVRADRDADAAVRAEPGNWRIAASLARLYRALAETDPGYEPAARAHLERARRLAPNRDIFPVWLRAPTDLVAAPRADGRLALRWQSGSGAGYYALSRAAKPGVWEFIYFSYDTSHNAFIAAPCAGCRYRIKACRYQGVCTEPVEWPAPGQ